MDRPVAWAGEPEADGRGGVRDVNALVAPASEDLLDPHPGAPFHDRLPALEPVRRSSRAEVTVRTA